MKGKSWIKILVRCNASVKDKYKWEHTHGLQVSTQSHFPCVHWGSAQEKRPLTAPWHTM